MTESISGNTLSHPPAGRGAPTETQRKSWVEDKTARRVRVAFLTLGILLTAIRVALHFPRAPVLWLMLLAPMALPFVIYYFIARTRFFSGAVGVALLPAIWFLLTPIGFWAILLNFAVVVSGAVTQEIVLGRRGKRGHTPSVASGTVDSRQVAATPKPDVEPHGGGSLP